MRTYVTLVAVSAFLVLGTMDIVAGNPRPGIASICLAVANALLLL